MQFVCLPHNCFPYLHFWSQLGVQACRSDCYHLGAAAAAATWTENFLMETICLKKYSCCCCNVSLERWWIFMRRGNIVGNNLRFPYSTRTYGLGCTLGITQFNYQIRAVNDINGNDGLNPPRWLWLTNGCERLPSSWLHRHLNLNSCLISPKFLHSPATRESSRNHVQRLQRG